MIYGGGTSFSHCPACGQPASKSGQLPCGHSTLGIAVNAAPDHQSSVAELQAEVERLNNRHVVFMVEGGPVVMKADYDKVEAERDSLEAQLAAAEAKIKRLEMPVTDEEKKRFGAYFQGLFGYSTAGVNALLAARAAQGEKL